MPQAQNLVLGEVNRIPVAKRVHYLALWVVLVARLGVIIFLMKGNADVFSGGLREHLLGEPVEFLVEDFFQRIERDALELSILDLFVQELLLALGIPTDDAFFVLSLLPLLASVVDGALGNRKGFVILEQGLVYERQRPMSYLKLPTSLPRSRF